MSEFLPDQPKRYISRDDHDNACMNVLQTTFENHDVLTNITAIGIEQQTIDAESVQALSDIGKYFIPLTSEGAVSSDPTRHEVYKIGMNMALCTLDALCERFDIDIDAFRKAWRITGLVRILDLTDSKVAAMTEKEKYESVAQVIDANGHAVMDELGDVYDPLIENMSELSPMTAANPGLLRASYGYILGGGLTALGRVLEELEIKRLTSSLDFDATLEQWSADPMMDILPFNREMDHESFANRIDRDAFNANEPVDAYIGKAIERQLDKDERNIELLNSLALVLYPNEYGNFSLDETGEAFFLGAVLALDTLDRYAASVSIDDAELRRAWRRQSMHIKLRKLDRFVKARLDEVEEHVRSVVIRPHMPFDYSEVLTKLSYELGHDEEEAPAFYQGFYYMLMTGEDAVKTCKSSAIGRLAKEAMSDIDTELQRLLEE